MRVENNLVMVIMGLLAVAVVLLVLYALYPMMVTWAAAVARWCCRRQTSATEASSRAGNLAAGDLVTAEIRPSECPPDAYSRWTAHESAVSFKTGSQSLVRQPSGAGTIGSRGRRGRRSDRMPNSRGVVWNARVFEGRPTVVTMGAQDALADLDSWRYTTRQLEAHWHVPLDASSSEDSVEIQVSAVPSSEEALAVVHPVSPPAHGPRRVTAPLVPITTTTSSEMKSAKLTTASEDDRSGSSTSEEEMDRRKTVCPSVPANALLRYVWGARSLAETAGPAAAAAGVSVPTGMTTRTNERPPQMVEVFAAGPSSIPGPSRVAGTSPRSNAPSPSLSAEHKSPPALPYAATKK